MMKKKYFLLIIFALIFNFGIKNGENYYIIDEGTFIQLYKLLFEKEN